ncbi:MAG: hypothetical protein KAX44_03505 [Candidatus Brocadiae bacterium]|nr:hypothetical protein [Candidatus Brocadiia bacterium]
MNLTGEEKKLVEPYLAMSIRDGKGWICGVVAGFLICAGALLVGYLGAWPVAGHYLLLVAVVGMVVAEISLNHRDKMRMGAVLQKYDAAVRGPERDAEEAST